MMATPKSGFSNFIFSSSSCCDFCCHNYIWKSIRNI